MTRLRGWIGWIIVALACGLAYPAHTVAPLLWPLVAILAWIGAYQTVAARGCGYGPDGDVIPSCECSAEPGRLGPGARSTRRRMGLWFLLLALVPAALGLWGWAIFWPLAFIGGWFAASLLVAAATGYPGCPEVGAIPSLLLRRPIVTRCPPMERIDRSRGQET